MALAVTSVASRGLAVTQSTMGMPVTAVASGGLAVTPVASGGMPVFDTGGTLFGPAVIPANTVLPVITGTTVVGNTLMTSSGTWSGTAATYTYQWQRNAAVTYATWDPATVTAVTLSGGNLVATSTGTTSQDQGAHVAAASGKTTGKYYFEVTLTAKLAGADLGYGFGTPTSTYTNMGNSGTVGNIVFPNSSGVVWANGTGTGASVAGLVTGNVLGIAVDLDNRRSWFRKAPSGNWNDSGTANPATNAGGVAIPAGTMVPFVTFGGPSGVSGSSATANFGASAFTGAVPSGFTAGWPT